MTTCSASWSPSDYAHPSASKIPSFPGSAEETAHNPAVAIISSYGHTAERSLSPVVVDFEPTVVQVTLERRPLRQGVVGRLRERALGKHFVSLGLEPDPELSQPRLGLFLPQLAAGRGIQSAGLLLHPVEQLDEGQRDQAAKLVARLRVIEASATVRPAPNLDDPGFSGHRVGLVEGVIPGVGVGLEVSAELFQEPAGVLPRPVRRVLVNGVGVGVVPAIDPEPSLPGVIPPPVEHRDRRVIGLDRVRTEDGALHLEHDRLEQGRALPHPVAERGRGESHSVPLQDPVPLMDPLPCPPFPVLAAPLAPLAAMSEPSPPAA